MHSKDRTCYLCMKLRNDYGIKRDLEEHHVSFGSANRKLSEKFGLKVYLCGVECHREGKESAHKNHDIALMLQQDAQRAFMRVYPNLDFRAIFGKSYVEDEEEKPVHGHEFDVDVGFQFIEGL